MHRPFIFRLLVCLLILNLDACGDVATLPEQAVSGVGGCPPFTCSGGVAQTLLAQHTPALLQRPGSGGLR